MLSYEDIALAGLIFHKNVASTRGSTLLCLCHQASSSPAR